MPADRRHLEIDEDEFTRLFHSAEFARFLDGIGADLTAAAIPHTGVDQAELVNSMGWALIDEGDHLTMIAGSNPDGPHPVAHAAPHWADRADPDNTRPERRRIRKRIPHPTKEAPTKPWTKAARQIGLDVTVEPGGFEA